MSDFAGMTLGDAYVNIMAETSVLQQGLLQSKAMVSTFLSDTSSMIAGGMTKAALIIPAVLGGALAYSVKQFMVAEIVSNRLAASIQMVGDKAEISMPYLEDLANAISEKTRYDDDAVKSAMASGMALGFNTKKIQEAMPAVVGLAARLNMNLGGAMRLMVRASQGHTQMLQRYGLQLDKNMTSEQKYQAVLKWGTEGVKVEESALHTLSGTLAKAREQWGEMAESIGGAFVQNTQVTASFWRMTESLMGWKKAVSEASSGAGGLVVGFATLALMWAQIATGFKVVGQAIKDFVYADVTAIIAVFNSILSPIKYVLEQIRAAFSNVFDWLKDYFSEIWRSVTNPFHTFKMPEWKGLFSGARENWQDTLNGMKGDWQEAVNGFGDFVSMEGSPGMQKVLDEYAARVKEIEEAAGAPPSSGIVGPRGTVGVGGTGEQAKSSIISVADIWKNMQQDAIKQKHDMKMEELAQAQLNELKKANASKSTDEGVFNNP